ncbi:hypothetical protein GCM10011405_23610 [Rufibacter glacialis]|nr:hypothetical protein GCM10011405_23610 [Rufibacter glacialis]
MEQTAQAERAVREGKTGPRGRERSEGSHATSRIRAYANAGHHASNGKRRAQEAVIQQFLVGVRLDSI